MSLQMNLNPQKIDPTRTKLLRDKFVRDISPRFRRVRSDIIKSVNKNDAFGLKLNVPVPPRAFAFDTDAAKVEGFLAWLQTEIDEGILEVGVGPIVPSSDPRWSDIYIASGYKRGVLRGETELAKQGVDITPFKFTAATGATALEALFLSPVHADRVALLYTRAFNKLRGITTEMSNVVGETLAAGLAAGKNPLTIGRELAHLIDKKGKTLALTTVDGRRVSSLNRAKSLARTEIIRAHAEGQLNMLEAAGIEQVKVLAEWSTAQDERVCELCAPLEAQVFTIAEARGLIPRHPQCRCTWIPYLQKDKRNTRSRLRRGRRRLDESIRRQAA